MFLAPRFSVILIFVNEKKEVGQLSGRNNRTGRTDGDGSSRSGVSGQASIIEIIVD